MGDVGAWKKIKTYFSAPKSFENARWSIGLFISEEARSSSQMRRLQTQAQRDCPRSSPWVESYEQTHEARDPRLRWFPVRRLRSITYRSCLPHWRAEDRLQDAQEQGSEERQVKQKLDSFI